MASRYKYDMGKEYAARGKARMDMVKQAQALASDSTKESTMVEEKKAQEKQANAKFQRIMNKNTNPTINRDSSELSNRNKSLCKPCRRIFDDLGNFAIPLFKHQRGLFFSHWDVISLKKSAKSGCSLCLLIYRALGIQFLILSNDEVLPSYYDFASLGVRDDAYALRFWYYAPIVRGSEVFPREFGPIVITVQDTNDLKEVIEKPILSSSTGSSESISQVLKWIQQCNELHCCFPAWLKENANFLPRRLVDVGSDSDNKCVRIIESEGLPLGTKYATLSHCWGIDEAVMTLQLTDKVVSQYKERLPVDQVPKTFAEAFAVTRQLGLRYIWIDSLCIIQNDHKDWFEQAAAMWEIYSHSYVSLAATDSSNSTKGLFRDRSPTNIQAAFVSVGENHHQIPHGNYCCFQDLEWLQYVENGPVNTRAWVYQERLLAPRIVHFAQDQIFWECHSVQASECFPKGLPPRYTKSTRPVLELTEAPEKKNFLEIWSSIVREYSERDLTYRGDKLIAVSALARQVLYSYPEAGKYVAGLWSSRILDQICWSIPGQGKRSETYRAPSWTWASIDGAINPNFNEMNIPNRWLRHVTSVVSISVAPINGPFDLVNSGVLRLAAPLVKAKLSRPTKEKCKIREEPQPKVLRMAINVQAGSIISDDSKWENENRPLGPRGFFWHLEVSDVHAIRGCLDDDRILLDREHEDFEKAKQDFYFLPVACLHERQRDERLPVIELQEIRGLILEPTGKKDGEYVRRGVCSVDEYKAGGLLVEIANQEPLDKTRYEEISPTPIEVKDFVPTNWSALELDFMPKQLDSYQRSAWTKIAEMLGFAGVLRAAGKMAECDTDYLSLNL